ncbi:MAG: DUF1893 domain-containing protein [Ruminococcaceae bacterium]|nr:DUF1893 domain-containing protein [Oscillospiraceae bacterium]
MLDLQNAKSELLGGKFTCVLFHDGETFSSSLRGVAPLLGFLDSGRDFRAFCAADKVVGKGAAFLYVLLGVRALFAHVISESALEVLRRAAVSVEFDTLVPYIKNRTGEGRCPIEQAVLEAEDATKALPLIRARLKELQKR